MSTGELRHLRKAARLSQTRVARLLNGSRQLVSNIEKPPGKEGRREPRRDEIQVFASLYRVSPLFLVGALPPAEVEDIEANLRTKDDGARPHDLWELMEIRESMSQLPPPDVDPAEWRGDERLSALCKTVRGAMGLPERLPVDVLKGCAGLKINTRFTSLEKFSGALIREAKRGKRVSLVINSDHPLERGTWTAAHELGHWVLGHKPGRLILREGPGDLDREEADADAFAAELLLPAEIVADEARQIEAETGAELAYRLATKACVSYRAMVMRLGQLTVLAPMAVDELLRVHPTDIEAKLELKAHKRSFNASVAMPRIEKRLRAREVLPQDWEEDFGDNDDPRSGLANLRRLQEAAMTEYIAATSSPERVPANDVYWGVADWVARAHPWR
jgi:transcriptional regulator with XRE-family HTH domain